MILIHLNKNANYCDSTALLKIIWDQIMMSNFHMSPLSCLIVAYSRNISCLISGYWDRLMEVQDWRKPEKKTVVHESAIKYTEIILDGCLIWLFSFFLFLWCSIPASDLFVLCCSRKLFCPQMHRACALKSHLHEATLRSCSEMVWCYVCRELLYIHISTMG